MKLHNIIGLFFWLLLFGKVDAQTNLFVEGVVVDSISGDFLEAVNIFDQESNTGTFSEMDGQFRIKVKKFPATIVFSFIGYENRILKLITQPTEPIRIKLQSSVFGLPGVEVIAEPKVEKITKPEFTVKDFVIENDKILIIKYGGLAVGNFLELKDLDGYVLHSLPVKMKGIIEKMHQSCLGNIHLIGNQEAVEVDFSSGKIKLVSKYKRAQFDKLIKPCVEASDDYVYIRREQYQGQQIRFDFISRQNRTIAQSVYVTDSENIDRIAYEFRGEGFSNYYYSISDTFNHSTNHRAELGIHRPEHYYVWASVFYKPLYSPLYMRGKEICIFNHTLGFLTFYSQNGDLLRQLPITYHQEKRWDKKVLKDKKTGKFYTVYKSAVGKKFYEIDFKDGSVNPAFKIDCAFVEKMVIHNDHLYYMDSGILPGKVNRILHKVKVR